MMKPKWLVRNIMKKKKEIHVATCQGILVWVINDCKSVSQIWFFSSISVAPNFVLYRCLLKLLVFPSSVSYIGLHFELSLWLFVNNQAEIYLIEITACVYFHFNEIYKQKIMSQTCCWIIHHYNICSC